MDEALNRPAILSECYTDNCISAHSERQVTLQLGTTFPFAG